MTLGTANKQGDLFNDLDRFLAEALDDGSVYVFLHRERDRLFPDEEFADLFERHGRRSVPPSVVAAVMVLQRAEGLSDREAVERFTFDARWRYATGVGGYGNDEAWKTFSHTVLVDMRERLRCSKRPDRVFEATIEAANAAGLMGRRRVLDSTPLYDAVATMDTVTLIRSAVRGLLKVADEKLEAELQAVLRSGDDYQTSAKPSIDWDDAEARVALIDSRAKDGYACLELLEGRPLDRPVWEAVKLLATVVGQDVEEGDDGVFRICRKVAKDRVISTVDPEARHGHKTESKGFDGYKGHIAIDPDSEIITATAVTAGNAGDASAAPGLIADLVQGREDERTAPPADASPAAGSTEPATTAKDAPIVYGDNAYGTGAFQDYLESTGIESRCKTQLPTAPGGLFAKDRFRIDLTAGTVTCPADVTVAVHFTPDGGGKASFEEACATCALRAHCTRAKAGRTITISPYERALAAARARQADPAWRADYRAIRPKVERKFGHLMRRLHGGRRVRMRGAAKICADFRVLAAAANLARLAILRATSISGRWAVAAA